MGEQVLGCLEVGPVEFVEVTAGWTDRPPLAAGGTFGFDVVVGSAYRRIAALPGERIGQEAVDEWMMMGVDAREVRVVRWTAEVGIETDSHSLAIVDTFGWDSCSHRQRTRREVIQRVMMLMRRASADDLVRETLSFGPTRAAGCSTVDVAWGLALGTVCKAPSVVQKNAEPVFPLARKQLFLQNLLWVCGV